MNNPYDYVTADWHIGETRFEIMQRPFKDQMEHVRALRDNFNAIVPKDAKVLFLGDAVYQKTPDFLKYVAEFNGVKTLIRGNHDEVFTDSDLAPYFEQIVPHGEGIELEVEGLPCYATHYPSQGRNDLFNIVGHIHSAWKYQLNMVNVGVDVNHFRPIPMSRIPFAYKAVSEFYDADVWVAYNIINQRYYLTRGQKTSYFKPQLEPTAK